MLLTKGSASITKTQCYGHTFYFYIQGKIMPRVAFFFGISIYMYLDDHGVPHCHAIYGDYAGSFSLQSGELMAGEIPPQQAKKIKDFILANQAELMEKWNEFSN
jgi:hypothetical protein